MKSPPGNSKQAIGFIQGIPLIRMEEEESPPDVYRRLDFQRGSAFPFESPDDAVGTDHDTSPDQSASSDRSIYVHALQGAIQERKRILDAIAVTNPSAKEMFRLLQENRLYMNLLQGGSPYKFRTEMVIYAMLAFSVVVLVILAALTAMGKLETEITTTFIGTVVGGMIATIAQKLGKVGR